MQLLHSVDREYSLDNPPDNLNSKPGSSPISNGVLSLIGSTPLVRLDRYLEQPTVELLVKLEAANPGGSAKDRPALAMLQNAMEEGLVTDRSLVIESSSGNMGIGLAQACNYYGLPFTCVADRHAQDQNLAIMKALGAQIDMVTRPYKGSYLAARLRRVASLLDAHPNGYWPNQYANLANPYSHECGTIREIDHALKGEFDYLFVATSSTGTARGCRDYLRKRRLQAKVVAVDSTGSVLFGGTMAKRHIPGLGAGIEPTLAKHQEFDVLKRVSDIDCVVGCRRAAERESLLVGGSAGGVLETIRKMQKPLRGKTCVAILHDSGTRYLDTIFNDNWVLNTLGHSPELIKERVK